MAAVIAVMAALAASAKEQFQQVYPGIVPRIKFRVTYASLFDFIKFSAILKRMLNQFNRMYPHDPRVQHLAAEAQRLSTGDQDRDVRTVAQDAVNHRLHVSRRAIAVVDDAQ